MRTLYIFLTLSLLVISLVGCGAAGEPEVVAETGVVAQFNATQTAEAALPSTPTPEPAEEVAPDRTNDEESLDEAGGDTEFSRGSEPLDDGWVRHFIPGLPIAVELPDHFVVIETDPEFWGARFGSDERRAVLPDGIRDRLDADEMEALIEQGVLFFAGDMKEYLATSHDFTPNVNVLSADIGDTPLDVVMEAHSEQWRMSGAEFVEEPLYLEGNGAESAILRFRFAASDQAPGIALEYSQGFIVVGSDLYILTITYTTELGEVYAPLAEEIIVRSSDVRQ